MLRRTNCIIIFIVSIRPFRLHSDHKVIYSLCPTDNWTNKKVFQQLKHTLNFRRRKDLRFRLHSRKRQNRQHNNRRRPNKHSKPVLRRRQHPDPLSPFHSHFLPFHIHSPERILTCQPYPAINIWTRLWWISMSNLQANFKYFHTINWLERCTIAIYKYPYNLYETDKWYCFETARIPVKGIHWIWPR